MGQREMTASDRLRPQWMHKLPVPSNLSFVYVVEKADGRTLEEAREACLLRLADNRQLMNTVHATAERDMEEEVRQRFVNGRLQERIDNRSTVRVKVRGGEAASPAASVYAADYADMGALKTFADRFGLCLVVVHHLRKSSDDADPFNRIAGSNGIFGAADAALVLTRAKREDSQTTLDLTGRDVEDKRLVLRFDKARCQWRSLGTPAEVERAQLAEGYADDPLVLTIRAQLAEGGGKWQTNAKGFLAACEALCGFCPVESGQALAKELDKLLPLLEEKDGIAARIESRGTAGRTYHFARQQTSPARNE